MRRLRPALTLAGAFAVALTAAGAQHAPNASPPRQAPPAAVGAQEAPAKPMDWLEEQLRSAGPAAGDAPGPTTGAAAAGATAGAAAAGSRVRLRADERTVIRDVVMRADVALRNPECRNEERPDFAVGRPFPYLTRVCRFPDEVNARVPNARPYRYLVVGNQIVLIDPDDHHIVEVLE